MSHSTITIYCHWEVPAHSLTHAPNYDVLQFIDLKDMVRQSGIIQKGQKVLVRSMALANMSSIVSQGMSLQDDDTLSLIEQDPRFLSSVIDILVEDLAWMKQSSLGSVSYHLTIRVLSSR